MNLVVALGAFVVGVVLTYIAGVRMLGPVYNLEAKIRKAARAPNEEEVGWGILNIRAELVMLRCGVTVLNGLAAAILAALLV